VLDARSRVEFDEGHVPEAMNLPASQTLARLPALIPDKRRMLIFYCNGPTCTKSKKAALVAIQLGYQRVVEYNEGLPAWRTAKQTVVGTPLPPVETLPVTASALAHEVAGQSKPILLDVRDAEEFGALHIPDSINVPLDEISKRASEIRKGSRVCIVDHVGHQTAVAARLLHSLGITDLERLEGGLMAWKEAGLSLWQREPGH
jgi:rhodanese-related sulfurtransferase